MFIETNPGNNMVAMLTNNNTDSYNRNNGSHVPENNNGNNRVYATNYSGKLTSTKKPVIHTK